MNAPTDGRVVRGFITGGFVRAYMSESKSFLDKPVSLSQIALVGAGVIVVGAFLPWVTTDIGTRVGISSLNGLVTLVVGSMVGVHALLDNLDQRVVLVAGGLCSVIGAYNSVFPLSAKLPFIGVYDTVFPLPAVFLELSVGSRFRSPAVGAYLTLFGGLVLLSLGSVQSYQ